MIFLEKCCGDIKCAKWYLLDVPKETPSGKIKLRDFYD